MKLREKVAVLVAEMLDGRILLGEAVREFERVYIETALDRNSNHISKTADALGVHRNTLSKRLESYNGASPKVTPTPISMSRRRKPAK